MDSILTTINQPGNEYITIILLGLATFRIYLEVIGFDFAKLPLTEKLSQVGSKDQMKKWHKMGLVFSIGYLILHAPQVLLGS